MNRYFPLILLGGWVTIGLILGLFWAILGCGPGVIIFSVIYAVMSFIMFIAWCDG